jgi:hypothetical protein
MRIHNTRPTSWIKPVNTAPILPLKAFKIDNLFALAAAKS